MTQSTPSFGAFAGVRWIELRPSRTATRLYYLYYGLIFLSIWIWQASLLWQFALSTLVIAFAGWHLSKPQLPLDAIALSYDKGVIACRCGGKIYQVKAFKVEYVLCYYIQISLQIDLKRYRRLYIFPDSVTSGGLRYIKCMGIHHKTA